MSTMPDIDIHSGAVADALTSANWDRPQSDVSNAVFQDKLADSLLSDEVRPLSSFDTDAASDERIREEWPNGFDDNEGPEGPQQVDVNESIRLSPEEAAEWSKQQEAQPQMPEPTIQEVREAIAGAQEFISENEYYTPEDGQRLAADLGMEPERAEQTAFALQTIAYGAAGILNQAGWDVANLRPMSESQLRATHDFVCREVRGIDPRLSPADPVALGADVTFFVTNYLASLNRHGVNADPSDVNDPRFAQAVVQTLNRHFGDNSPVDLETAVRVVDALTRPIQAMAQRVMARQPQQAPKPSRSPQRMTQADDLFDEEAIALYRQREGKL